jgi:hypothetical protein
MPLEHLFLCCCNQVLTSVHESLADSNHGTLMSPSAFATKRLLWRYKLCWHQSRQHHVIKQ